MSIRFYKADGPIRVYDGTRYLVLGPKKYDSIYNRIRYFIVLKSGIAYAFCHNCARMKADLYYSFPIWKTLTFYNVIILIRSVLNKDKNNYYYNTFPEKCSYK